MDEIGLFNTIGRDRSDCIENAKALVRRGDQNAYKHLSIENDRYYDSLDDAVDDSDCPKKNLKEKWDKLSSWKQKQMVEWKKHFDSADSYNRHDMLEQKKQILWIYEKERFVHAELNYHYFKTYWEESQRDYALK